MADETRNLDRSIGSNHWSIYIPGRPTAKKWSQKWRTWVFERQFQAPTRSPWISRWLHRGLKLPCFFSPCALANSAGGGTFADPNDVLSSNIVAQLSSWPIRMYFPNPEKWRDGCLSSNSKFKMEFEPLCRPERLIEFQ